MQILVVGAGIAGLAAARALTRSGHAVEVVERAADAEQVGAGIYLPGNAVRALTQVGLTDLGGAEIRTQRVLDHRGRELSAVDLPSFWAPCGPCLGLRRADLHRALTTGVPVRYGLEPLALDPDAATVELSDGSRRQVDLVVGADGIRSSVRALLGDPRPPVPLGMRSWRFVVDLPGVDAWTALLGRDSSFLLVPIGAGQVYCYADTTGPADRLPDVLAGYADPVPAALAALGDPAAAYASSLAEAPPHAPPTGRVVLIGDAAHATAPNMAQGVAMAVEDALVLAAELTEPEAVPAALTAFTGRRKPRTDWVRGRAHRRDRTRGLPVPIRDVALRLAFERIYRADYRPLLVEP